VVRRKHLQERPAPPTAGNLFAPASGWTGVDGGWSTRTPSPPSRSWWRPARLGLLAAAALLIVRR
jgi:hypothetical protein